MKRLSILLLALVLVATLFVACSTESDDVNGTATLRFTTGSNTRALTVSTNTLPDDVTSKDDLIWFYTAAKLDSSNTINYGATPDDGRVAKLKSLSYEVGPFSLGYWDFTLYGFTKGNEPEYADDEGYYTIGTSNYYTLSGSASSVLISKQKNGATQQVSIPIVASKQSKDGTGTLVIEKVALVNKDGTAYKDLVATNVTCKSIKYPEGSGHSAGEEITFTSEDSSWKRTYLASGTYKVTIVYEAQESGKTIQYASNTVIVDVYDDRTTTVSGTLDEYTQAVVFDVSVGSKIQVTKTISQASDLTDGITFTCSPTATTYSSTDETNTTTVKASTAAFKTDTTTGAAIALTTYGVATDDTEFVFEATSSNGTVKYGWDLDLDEDNITIASTSTADAYVTVKSYIGTGLTNEAFTYKAGTEAGSVANEELCISAGSYYYDSSSGFITFVAKFFAKTN